MARVFHDLPSAGVLDFVAAWYRKAADYMAGNDKIKTGFVSTNSITQGEQVCVLWPDLLKRGVKIHFAHRTFQWSSEARGKAAVHCVIIGFALHDCANKRLFDYESVQAEAHEVRAGNINPYLVDAPDVTLTKRMLPLCDAPKMDFGSKAVDFGHLTLSEDERAELLRKHPGAKYWVRPFIGSEEFINGIHRYCLWLKDISAKELRSYPWIISRVEAVRAARLKSDKQQTKDSAEFPTLFGEDRQPTENYLLVPKVSSERRKYIPLGFCGSDLITNPSVLVVPGADFFHFGILQSAMHMAWMRAVCGRMKSDYQYSNTIVYNNFPWPEVMTVKQRKTIEDAAQVALDARAKYPESTLADLYDPLAMPADLTTAHQKLDTAVDAAYSKKKFEGDRDRVAFLFERYQQLLSPLEGKKKVRRKAA